MSTTATSPPAVHATPSPPPQQLPILTDIPIDPILRMLPVHNSHDIHHATTAMAIRAVNREYMHSSRLCWRSKCYVHPQGPEKIYLTEEYGEEEEVEVTDDEIPESGAAGGDEEDECNNNAASQNGGGGAKAAVPSSSSASSSQQQQTDNTRGNKRTKTILRHRLLVELELTHPKHAATAMKILGGTY